MGPQAQALSQPAVVRSDLSGVISESFEGILFFLEALWPGRTSFPFSLENKKKPCRLGRRGSQIPGLFLDYIINCVPFLDGLRNSLCPHRGPLRSCLRTGPYPSGKDCGGTQDIFWFSCSPAVLCLVLALSLKSCHCQEILPQPCSFLIWREATQPHPASTSLSGGPWKLWICRQRQKDYAVSPQPSGCENSPGAV